MVEGTMGSHHKERSTKMNKHNMLCAGIDTGKRKLEVALTSGLRLQIDNNAEGHAALSGWLRKHRIKRVGIDASGGYEREVVAQLRRWRFVVVVFQPAQVRAYAKFHLQRAKNDKIDAGLIALCTADVRKIHAPPDARLIPLAERLTFMEQITEDMARAKNRHESCRDPRTKRHWEAEIARLKGVLRIELKALVADIRQHSDLSKRLDLIASVDGLGYALPLRSRSVCPRSAVSPASKLLRLSALLPLTTTVAIRLVSVTSRVDANGCAKRCTRQRCRPFSNGTISSSSCIDGSLPPANRTSLRLWPAHANSSSTLILSSSAVPRGLHCELPLSLPVIVLVSFFVRLEGPFLRPDLTHRRRRAQPRSSLAVAKSCADLSIARPRLDGGEHGVILQVEGPINAGGGPD